MKVFLNRYRGDFALKATAHGRFALATKALPSRVLHLVGDVAAVWTRDRRGLPARLQRLAAEAKCGRNLASVTIHHEPPADFELCDYCLIAVLGLDVNPAAPVSIARVTPADLDRVERSIGVPASRRVRMARIKAGAA